MFTGLSFTVVPYSIDIGKKRKKILEDIIIKHKGKIINLEQINSKLIPDFILTSKNVNNIFDIFPRKQIGAIQKEERCNFLNIIFRRIINYEWLSNCVKEKKIIDVDDYTINIEELCIKKKSSSRISSQSNKISDIQQLKEDLNISINNNINNNNAVTNNFLLNESNKSNSLSQSQYTQYSSSSFNSNTFDFENDLNINDDMSDEELFDHIKNHLINKRDNPNNNNEEEKKETLSSINSEDNSEDNNHHNIFSSFNSTIDTIDNMQNFNFSESQEVKGANNEFSKRSTNGKISKSGNISVPKPFMKNKNKFRKINSNYFAFNLGKSNLNVNKNKHLTDEFEKILEFHTNEGNKFEALAYRKVIGILKKYKEEINDPNKIPKIKGIGPKITEKIKEILITGKCRKSDNVSNDAKNKCIKELTTVHGIGIKQANEFYAQGIKGINDLRNIYDNLPSTIQKGLKYYDDIQIKIPREEITELFKIIVEELYTILDKKTLKAEVVGSYRRGKKLCGDMDIIITRIDDGKISGILHTLVDKLTEKKIIVDTLTMSDNNDTNCQIFMGICKLNENSLYRRLDIKVYEKSLFPFAILYFTGSAYFNRSLRLFAKKKGMHLSDKELSNRFTGVKIMCNSEEDIFKALDLKYKTPEERDI
jgi:DNA polymerase/3'-5' exonuclease PolX